MEVYSYVVKQIPEARSSARFRYLNISRKGEKRYMDMPYFSFQVIFAYPISKDKTRL